MHSESKISCALWKCSPCASQMTEGVLCHRVTEQNKNKAKNLGPRLATKAQLAVCLGTLFDENYQENKYMSELK